MSGLAAILRGMVTHRVLVERPDGASASGLAEWSVVGQDVAVRMTTQQADAVQELGGRLKWPTTHSLRCELGTGIREGDRITITGAKSGGSWTAISGGDVFRVLSAAEPPGLSGPDHVHCQLSTFGE